VALSPAPPKGILVLPFSSLKAAAPALAHPSRWHGVVTLTPEEFTYGFVNTFSPEEAAAAYERYAVPETGQIFYEAGFANFRARRRRPSTSSSRAGRTCSWRPRAGTRLPPRSTAGSTEYWRRHRQG
jgi:hypothetical protein